MDENPAHEQLLILSLDNWEAEIPTDVHIATITTQNPRRQNSETDNPKKKALKLLLIKRTNKLLGGSSFQSKLRSSVSRFCLQIVSGILAFFLSMTMLMMMMKILLLGGGSMRMGLIPCVGFGDVCLSVLRVTCGSVILAASWICDTCVHL